jgi:hypothetical protein
VVDDLLGGGAGTIPRHQIEAIRDLRRQLLSMREPFLWGSLHPAPTLINRRPRGVTPTEPG